MDTWILRRMFIYLIYLSSEAIIKKSITKYSLKVLPDRVELFYLHVSLVLFFLVSRINIAQ